MQKYDNAEILTVTNKMDDVAGTPSDSFTAQKPIASAHCQPYGTDSLPCILGFYFGPSGRRG